MSHRSIWSPANLVLFLTWLLFGTYYLARFNYSAVIPLLRADLGISNAQAGSLMAFFFIMYAAFQLPAGHLGDHFGPRKILTFGAFVSIFGNLIFSQGKSFHVLAIGQMVNGLGQAVGWSSAVKLVVNWFSKASRGTAIGLFVTCVTAGSSAGIRISGFLGANFGWQSSFMVPPAVMALVAIVFWILIRDHPSEKGLPDFEDETHLEEKLNSDPRSRLAVVLSNRTLWTVAVVYFCFVYVQFGCLVWIPSFLTESYGLSVNRASSISSLVLLSGFLASPLGGFLSDRVCGGRRKPLIVMGMAVLSASAFLLSLKVSIGLAIIILAVLGLMILMPDVLLSTYPSDLLSRKFSATAMGFLTTFTSLAGILSTPVSGKITDIFRSYGPLFFSFSVIALVGTVLALLIKEETGP